MPTDFERDLSELLHTVTPEPPDHLVPPRVSALSEARRADAGADVIELGPHTGHTATRPYLRWPVFVAAAAVAALAAGVVALVQTGNDGHHPATQQSAASGPTNTGTPTNTSTPTKTSSVATLPSCRGSQQVSAIASGPLAWYGHPYAPAGNTGTYRFGFRNRSANPCTLSVGPVEIGRDVLRSGIIPPADAAFPASTGKVSVPAHRRVMYTAHFRVTGHCKTVEDGKGDLAFYVHQRSLASIVALGIKGCTLTPLRLTHRIVG